MTKAQKKALRFAYKLMNGDYDGDYMPFVHRTYRIASMKWLGMWIEPDRSPMRPYLNEETFTSLVMQGYMDCREFMPGPMWLYRISRKGCAKIGKEWPIEPIYRIAPGKSPNRHLTRNLTRYRWRKRDNHDIGEAMPQGQRFGPAKQKPAFKGRNN